MKAADFFLALIATGAVLAFGGVQSITFSLMQIGVMLLAVCVFWKAGWPDLSRPSLAVLGIVLAVPLLQTIPLPNALLGRLSPMRLALGEQLLASQKLVLGAMPITINPHATWLAFLQLVCYTLVFVLGFQVRRRRAGSSLLIVFMICIGLFEASYGLVQYLTGWQYIFSYEKKYGLDQATGTYINANHYAGLLEMVLPFIFAGIWFRLPGKDRAARGALRHFLTSGFSAQWVARGLLFTVVLIGLVFSKSRTGIMAAFAGLLVVVVIELFKTRKPSALGAVVLVLGAPLAYSVWIGLAPVQQRFELLGSQAHLEQERLPIWRDTLTLIRDYPLLGTGLGTYPWASLHYQTQLLYYRYEHAHSDYLEFASDIGIPATVLLFASLWTLTVSAARRALLLERTNDRVLAAGCAGALAALLTHSLADFNLQIPANAFVFAWIAGTAAGLTRPVALQPGGFER